MPLKAVMRSLLLVAAISGFGNLEVRDRALGFGEAHASQRGSGTLGAEITEIRAGTRQFFANLDKRGRVLKKGGHDGEPCHGGAQSGVQFGNGQETVCESHTYNGQSGKMCCPMTCTYFCKNMVDGKGQFEGQCSVQSGESCTWVPDSGGTQFQTMPAH